VQLKGFLSPPVPSISMAAAGGDQRGQGCSSPRPLQAGDAAAASQPRGSPGAGAGAMARGSAFLPRMRPVLAEIARPWVTKVVASSERQDKEPHLSHLHIYILAEPPVCSLGGSHVPGGGRCACNPGFPGGLDAWGSWAELSGGT